MFWPDTASLQQFYATPSGKMACKAVRQKIAGLWPDIQHRSVIGVGFASPFLEGLQPLGLFMPAPQGVIHWPEGELNRTCLTSETSLPLADNSVDRIMLVHVLEYSPHPQSLMREMWRVLKPHGKILLVAPNQLGMWAHSDRTPFSRGRAFHRFQLMNLLKNACFVPQNSSAALFAPPLFAGFLPKITLLEQLGGMGLQPFGGVFIVEGEKQLYSLTSIEGRKSRRFSRVFVPA